MANLSTAWNSSTLFPILQPVNGIARMAAEATHVADGHLVEFRAMEVRGILNKTVSRRQLRFGWSINPYRGCEFGCQYCYARYTHEFLAPTTAAEGGPDFHDPGLFERLIYMKENAAWLLEQELRKHDPAEEIALGTATDPYQPIERTAGITRSLLEVFARRSGLRLGIVTKSKLIERDIDLLRAIARKNTLVLHVTITTPDAELARILEPRAPRPDLRFAAARSRADGWRAVLSAAAGDYRYRRGAGSDGWTGGCISREFLCSLSPVLEVVLTSYIPGLRS